MKLDIDNWGPATLLKNWWVSVKNVFKTIEDDFNSAENKLDTHISNKANPHSVTKTQVGLGNVPNVSTNDQTPTYTEASTLTALTSGEKLSVAFGKLKKAVSSFISHRTGAVLDHPDKSVTTEKIADNAVTRDKIAEDAITNSKIANGAVTSITLANTAVHTEKIQDGAVTADKIEEYAITKTKIADDTITDEKLARGTISARAISTDVWQMIIDMAGESDGNVLNLTELQVGQIPGTEYYQFENGAYVIYNDTGKDVSVLPDPVSTQGFTPSKIIESGKTYLIAVIRQPAPKEYVTIPVYELPNGSYADRVAAMKKYVMQEIVKIMNEPGEDLSLYKDENGYFDFNGNDTFFVYNDLSEYTDYLPAHDEYGYDLSASISKGQSYLMHIVSKPVGGVEVQNGYIEVIRGESVEDRINMLEQAIGINPIYEEPTPLTGSFSDDGLWLVLDHEITKGQKYLISSSGGYFDGVRTPTKEYLVYGIDGDSSVHKGERAVLVFPDDDSDKCWVVSRYRDTDASLSTTSENPVQNKVVAEELAKKANTEDIPAIDTALSTTSENPVQNKVVTAELNNKANKSTIVPNNNLQGSGRPNKPTWYRIAEFSGTDEIISKGASCNSCEIIIKRKFENFNNEFHHLYLSSIYWSSAFGSIANRTAANSQAFTKIRHVYNSADKKAYIDVYHWYDTGNITNVYINNGVTSGGYWKPISWFSETAETAENETILSTYNIPANSKNLTSTDVDTVLSTTSTNPVQNKVVQAAISALEARIAALEG